jgi:2-dehydro-3-deoxyphosphogluconate aldolase/(4S)-4-hydroxy-2-oxoglutarate aldolase
MPTGGVGIDDVAGFLDRGAAAVGLSVPLLGDSLLPRGDLVALAARARQAIVAVGSR